MIFKEHAEMNGNEMSLRAASASEQVTAAGQGFAR